MAKIRNTMSIQTKGGASMLPVAIIIAAIIIGGAILFTRNNIGVNPSDNNGDGGPDITEIEAVTANDHIIGNPNADVIIIEYSDLECQFCKAFHKTMDRIIDEYGDDGRVAWVYRHYPLDQIHARARPAAEISECVASIGGEDAFWSFLETTFEGAPNILTSEGLKQVALDLGVDEAAYTECVDNRDGANAVREDQAGARALGQIGTPYSVVISKDGTTSFINGNQSYEFVKQVIETMLLGGTIVE